MRKQNFCEGLSIPAIVWGYSKRHLRNGFWLPNNHSGSETSVILRGWVHCDTAMKFNIESRCAADKFSTYITGGTIALGAYLTSPFLTQIPIIAVLVGSGLLTILAYRFSGDERTHRQAGTSLSTAARLLIALGAGATIADPQLRATGAWVLAPVPVFAEAFVRRDFLRSISFCAATVAVEAYAASVAHHMLSLAAIPAALTAMGWAIGYVLARLINREAVLAGQEQRLGTVLQCGTELSESCDLKATILHNLKAAVRETGASCGFVMLVNESNKNELITEVAYSHDGEFDFPERQEVGTGFSGYVAKVGQPISVTGDENGIDDFGALPIGVRAAAGIPLIVRTHSGGGEAAVDQILGVMTILDHDTKESFNDANMDLIRSLGSLIAVAVSSARMEERRRTTFLLTLESLATALEARDEYTRGHSQRVSDVSLMIGEKLGFGPEAMEELRVGTILHDIGKIGVPDAILNKRARLTDEEFAIMKTHPVIGYEICRPLSLSEGVLMIIRNHHEKLDGSGYPDGLKGGELPLSLRVVCVADAFDAMSSRRPYRTVMETSTVLAELSKGAGTQFDPVVVEILKDLMATDRLLDLYRQYWGDTELKAA